MKKTNISIFTVIIGIFYLLFSDSCANPGSGPQGGPKDSIPPVILNMVPTNYATNVSHNEITISFDEYVVPDNLSSKLVVSPPLAEKPTIRTKGKSVVIKFEEDLIPNRTYSVDLKDGIKDYNEGNKIESLRMLFSTYDQIDTLRISGYLIDAFTLTPLENTIATLYTIDEDSLFSTLRPDYIAKTDNEGFFMFDNLSEGKYKLYGLIDLNNDLMYSQAEEQIAFIDSFIIPSANFVAKTDTIFQGEDTIITQGYTEYFPESVHSFLFTEDRYQQYIIEDKRETNDKILVTFNESLTDSFNYELINVDTLSIYTEFGINKDSITIWLTDTLWVNNDSLLMKLDYTITDTLNNFVTQTDTLRMYFSPKKNKTKSRGKKEKEANEKSTKTFTLSTNLSASVDLNAPIILESPSPIEEFEDSIINFQIAINDSTFEDIPFTINWVKNSKRKLKIDYKPEEGTTYRFAIDSAAIYTLTGFPNLAIETKFTTKTIDEYGTAIFNISGINSPAYVQLLKNSKDENLIKEQKIEKDGQVSFGYLKPAKYIVKLWEDKNNNGKWDTGNLAERTQPEPVYYFEKIINIKANWDAEESWLIEPGKFSQKNMTDPDKKEDK